MLTVAACFALVLGGFMMGAGLVLAIVYHGE